MAALRVNNFSVSIDGYGAGPDQDIDNPLGVDGLRLHQWVFETRTWNKRRGAPGGTAGVDDRFIEEGDAGIGATIMGRNMFGPIRGEWPDESWTGWWGDDPPYHHNVFVLTHHPRAPITMKGGTTFNFVSDGIETALQLAFEASGGRDVRLGGGVATIQEYLRSGLVDEMNLAIVPVLLGGGERLWDNVDGFSSNYECVELVSSSAVIHARFARRAPARE
jgi:dihydrofolate reductase